MDEEILNQTLEQLREMLVATVMKCGDFRDERVVEISQILDMLILHSQRCKWNNQYEVNIRSTA